MKSVLTFIALFGLATQSPGQDLLTMEHAVNLALENNHSHRSAFHGLQSAQWGKRSAITNFLPRVEILTGVTRIDPETERRANAAVEFIRAGAGQLGIPPSMLSDLRPFAYRDEYDTKITVVQPIYNGGAELAALHAAQAIEDRDEFNFQDSEQDIIARVRIAYFSVLKGEALLALARESAARTGRWLDMTRRRESLGSRTQTDVLRFEVQLAADEGQIVNSENGLASARLHLNELMGVPLDKEYSLQPIMPADSIVAAKDSPPLLTSLFSLPAVETPTLEGRLIAAHPSMKMMEANLRLADANISKSWVNFKPHVNLAFQYGWEPNNTFALDGIRPWALSLLVRVPIFNSFGDYANLQKAHAEYDRAREQVEGFRRSLQVQATNAELALRASKKRFEIAKIGLRQAEEVLSSIARRYDLGAASNVDVIDAQTAYTSAKTSYITAWYDTLISEVQLARATGKSVR